MNSIEFRGKNKYLLFIYKIKENLSQNQFLLKVLDHMQPDSSLNSKNANYSAIGLNISSSSLIDNSMIEKSNNISNANENDNVEKLNRSNQIDQSQLDRTLIGVFDEVETSNNLSSADSRSVQYTQENNENNESSVSSINDQFQEQIKKEFNLSSSFNIPVQKVPDNSNSVSFIKNNLIEKIPAENSEVSHTLINRNLQFTFSGQRNNLFAINSSSQDLNNLTNNSHKTQYDDGKLEEVRKQSSQNISKEKEQAFEMRKQIWEKQQLLVPKVDKSQQRQIQKESLLKDQKRQEKNINVPKIKPQNIQNVNVLKQMYNSDQDEMKKRYKWIKKKHYNVFYIDQITPFHDHYSLDLSQKIPKIISQKNKLNKLNNLAQKQQNKKTQSQQNKSFPFNMKKFTSVAWKNIVCLVIKGCKIDDEKFKLFVDSSQKFPYLIRIDFSENKITDKGFIYFVEHSHKFKYLVDIFFQQNKITNHGFKALSIEPMNFMFYKRMHFSENFINDEEYEFFFAMGAFHPNLIQIKFDGNPKIYKQQLGNLSLKSLSSNQNFFQRLRHIHFRKNLISDEGIKVFSNYMFKLNELYDINFGINKITSKGFEYFLNKIDQLDSIQYVYFGENLIEKIPQQSLKQLISNHYYTKLVSIDLRKNSLEKNQRSCFFLADIFFNMKPQFKIYLVLNTPYALNLQNIKYDFKGAISIINGSDQSVFKPIKNDSTRNQTFIQKTQNHMKKSKEKRNEHDIRFQRLSQLNLSDPKFTSQDWSLLVDNINSLPQLQEININENVIEIIKMQELQHLQKLVSERNKKLARILKITLTKNRLNQESMHVIKKFIQKSQNRCVFLLLSSENILRQKQLISSSEIAHEQQQYQRLYFTIKIQSAFQFGLKGIAQKKNIDEPKYVKKFIKALTEIISLCNQEVYLFLKMKLMLFQFSQTLKNDRIFLKRKYEIDRICNIIQSFIISLINNWCENIKNNKRQISFSEESVENIVQEIRKIKCQKKNERKEAKKKLQSPQKKE